MAMPISNTHLRVPRGFGAILEGLTREILRDQPKDIPQYAAEYFDTLIKQRKERGTDPSEWAAKSEDRYYNNHLFKTLDCTSRTASNINSQDFIAEEEPSPVITHAGSAKGPLDTDTTSSTQADGLSNKINSSAASEQNNSESERHETQLLPATEKIEISDDGDQENTDLEAEPGNVTVSAVDLEKETAASVIEEDAFQKDSFKPSEVRQQSPVSQLEITEQKEEMTSANDTATDVLEESSKHESFVEISFDDVPENDQSENNEQMIKEIMDKTEEILNEQEEQLEKERPGVEYEETVRQSDIKTDDQQTDIKTDDQQTDIKTDDQQTDIKTDDQQTDIKTDDQQTDIKTDDQQTDINTDDQQTDINTDDQQTDIKTDDQQTDINTDDQQTDIKTDDQEDEEINIPNNNKNPSLQDLTEDTSGIVEERREGETEDDPQKSEDAAGDLTQLDENVKILEQQEIQEKNEDDLLEGNEEEQEEGSLEKYFPVSHEDQHSDEEELEEGFSESEIREGHFSPELDHDDPELGQWADREDNNLHQGKRDSPDREKQINEKQEECSRPQEEEDIMDIPLDDPEANRAAAKIQAGFRGHMTRKKMKPEDKTEGEERAEDRGQ